jgi:colanic acid/amylovoran biosynthesis glycosyltransferase
MTAFGPLTLLPPLTGYQLDDERVVLTRKFVEGVLRYTRSWPGAVKVVLNPAESMTDDLDHVTVRVRDLPFKVEFCHFGSPALRGKLAGSAVVSGGPDYRMPDLAEVCRSLKVPLVNVTEYSLRTRLQIARMRAPNTARFMRTAAWEFNQERLTLASIARSAGVQCNGTPTFSLYRRFSSNALLYFDTRTEHSMFATPDDMAERARRLYDGRPLTLAFSGRLIPMKGALDLIEVASQLKRCGFPFRFLIAGEGSSADAMRERVAREGLREVEFLGVLPFATGLMPLMRREVDLFVACHRQGDPSCTYLETLAAGVPVVGYRNEAFQGLLDLAEVGFGAPLDRPEKVVQAIVQLSREEIMARAESGLRFAREHSFEKTFERRVSHLANVAERYHVGKKPRHSTMPALGA